MHKLPLFFCLLFTFCANLRAQPPISQNDSTAALILNELQQIRGIQEESRGQRLVAIYERQKRDSIQNRQSEIDLVSDYGIMARIEENTQQRPYRDGWNLYGWSAIIIAMLSLGVSIYTYLAQKNTENNTKKLSQDMQRRLLNELLRHLYRNFVIIYTMRTKLEDIDFKGYPSEEHFEKLKIPLTNLHLDAFYGHDENYRLMHILYLNMRNFNEEVDVALRHIVNPNLSKETKIEDLDTLEFKISYLTGRIIDTIKKIWGASSQNVSDMRDAITVSLQGKTNASDNIDIDESDRFTPLSFEAFKKTKYAELYNDESLHKLCEIFNHDVREERKKNQRGAWKVRIIRY